MALSKYIEDLQARGRYSFSALSLASQTEKTEKAIERAISKLRLKGAIASPRKGFYVIVPPEYRALGCLPTSWFIDDMMKFVGVRYYVGLLSAAELYGAAHHKPQELQVVTNRPYRSVQCGKIRIRFFSKRYLEKSITKKHKTRTGYMHVSSPETTALDLVRYSFELGGLSSVAPVIAELADNLTPRELVKSAKNFELSAVQRLGFLLDQLHKEKLCIPLSKWLLEQRPRVVLLSSHKRTNSGTIDDRWCLKVNEEVDFEA